MTKKKIIDGLQFTIEMFLIDPCTGEKLAEPRNEMDKITIEACRCAIEALENESCEDCISRKATIHALGEVHPLDYNVQAIKTRIEQLPSVQPIRVKGEWQITDAYPHNVYCSICHTKFAQTHWAVWEDGSLPRNYCPNCGADMRGEE